MKRYLFYLLALECLLLGLYACREKVSKEPGPDQRVTNEQAPPSDLKYSDTLFVQFGRNAISVEPTVNGSRPMIFELVNVTDNRFSINSQTGQITVRGGVPAGTYSLSVKATNAKASYIKNNALVVVVWTIVPSRVEYSPSFVVVDSGTAYVTAAPTTNASQVTYRIQNRSEVPAGIVIDSLTGIIRFPDTLRSNIYRIRLQLVNSAGAFSRTDAFILVVRPRGYTPGAYPTWTWEIRPILARRGCTNCHITRGHITGIGTDYQALVNKHQEVMKRITIPAWEPFIMPPPAEGYDPLTPEEIQTFRKWAEGGFLR
ncbi:MAG: hypothetical protein NZM38_04240 [Cytophagales bacterium]|nr:hypothetical protein [Cytophagales bacterium]MDW8383961.1 hypothetical protein [Flammeovirgaceae bacterium]